MRELIAGTIYDVSDRIGSGSYGTVHRARVEGSDTIYAVKSIRFDDMKEVTPAMTETSVLGILNHPNIVQCIAADVISCSVKIVMRDEGPSLHGRRFSGDQLKKIMFQLLHAEMHMEERGVIHRDLKPENILMKKDTCTPVIIDFGMASLHKSDRMDGGLCTLWWRHPDIIRTRNQPYDNRVDIWSLGVIMYNLITGENLFAVDTTAEYLTLTSGRFQNGREWLSSVSSLKFTQYRSLNLKFQDMSIARDEIDMMTYMLQLRHNDTPTPLQCLQHKYFQGITLPTVMEICDPHIYPMTSKVLRTHRVILFDWIVELCKWGRFSRDMVITTIHIFDRYERSILPDGQIEKSLLQATACACLGLALSTSQEHELDVETLGRMCDGAPGSSSIPEKMKKIYVALGGRLVIHDRMNVPNEHVWALIKGDVLDGQNTSTSEGLDPKCISRLMRL